MEEAAAKVEVEEEADAEQLEVAAILCDMSRLMRARDRRKRRRERVRAAAAYPEIPSWGRRRPRSMLEDKPSPAPGPDPAPAPAAASPDTPLAYPESGGDDAPLEDKGEVAAARPRDQWAEEQHGEAAAASLSQPQENARPLKVARTEQDPVPAPLVVLDLNEPADEDEQQQLLQAQQARARAAAAAAAAEWYRQAQLRAVLQKAAVSAGARRRRLEILRAKAACPLVSTRMRRAG